MKSLINQDGTAAYQWVKQAVNKRDDSYYAGSPGYHMIKKSSTGAIYAFRRPIDLENPLPHHLEVCTLYEIQKLDSKA